MFVPDRSLTQFEMTEEATRVDFQELKRLISLDWRAIVQHEPYNDDDQLEPSEIEDFALKLQKIKVAAAVAAARRNEEASNSASAFTRVEASAHVPVQIKRENIKPEQYDGGTDE